MRAKSLAELHYAKLNDEELRILKDAEEKINLQRGHTPVVLMALVPPEQARSGS